jgi:anti-sigma28 factor (negative regulator of flagellin synthesis)
MSIRIDNDTLTGAAASPASKSCQTGSTGAKSLSSTGQSTGKDSVEISSITSNLINAGSAQDADRAKRITQLAAAYANGSYQPDSLNISKALVQQAINGAPQGGEA